MNGDDKVLGIITQTSPPSTPLDTLKALVLRTIDRLDYVIDRLCDPDCGVADDVFEFIDDIKQTQYRALAEHVHVAVDPRLNELRHVHPDGYRYADGSPVIETWSDQYGVTDYYPRYDGDRAAQLQWFSDWVAGNRERAETELAFNSIVGKEPDDEFFDGTDLGDN